MICADMVATFLILNMLYLFLLFKNNPKISVDLKTNAWENYWWIGFEMEGLASDI